MKTLPAFQRGSVFNAALEYHDLGFSVIPCNVNKTPAIKWQQYQQYRPPAGKIHEWFSDWKHHVTGIVGKGYQSIGVVCGNVSRNLVVVDLDGWGAVREFYTALPQYQQRTLTIKTGSGAGVHLYFFVRYMPQNVNVRTTVGGFEIRGNGQYVIAPPSPHESGNRYTVLAAREIASVSNLDDVADWFLSMRRTEEQHIAAVSLVSDLKTNDARITAYLTKAVSEELTNVRWAPLHHG